MKDLAYLTVQERIELYKKDMAFSPHDAAKRVIGIADAVLDEFMNFNKEQTGKLKLDSADATYSEYCSVLKSKISKELRKTDKSLYESRFGNIYSDYVYLAALSLAAIPGRPKYSRPLIYYSLRMTLGNYLDALIDISSEKEKLNTRRANRYRKLKKEFSEIIDLSTMLCEAIGILLSQYSNSHAEIDRLNHILRCQSALERFNQLDEMREENSDYNKEYADDNDEQECVIEISNCNEDIEPLGFIADDFNNEFDDEVFDEDYFDDEDFDDDLDDDDSDDEPVPEDIEQREKEMLIAAGDPYEYFISEARKLPDISVKSPEKLYAMGNNNPNLLADKDHSPEALKVCKAGLSPDFRKIADEVITAETIASAFKGMDAATDKLYRLLVEPFAEIGRFRFKRHLPNEI